MVDFGAVLGEGGIEEPAVEPQVAKQPPASLDIKTVKLRLAKYDKEVDKMVETATALEILDDVSRAAGTDMASDARKIERAIEEVRAFYKRPALEYGRAVDNLAQQFKGRLQQVVNTIKQKDRQYQAKLDLEHRKQQEAARKAQEDLQKKIDDEAKAAGVEAPKVEAPVVAPPPSAVKTEKGSISYREVWKFKVTDESKVPRDYLSVDERKIRDAVKNGIRQIDGVEIYSEKEPVLR
jgi:hypothetical protein